MTVASTTLASVLADLALAHELAPWPCPAYFGPSTPPPAPAPHRYILVELIASGPRSLVYRALDTAFSDAALNTATPHTAGRPVVIKINPHHTDAPLEALAVARVKHPNVVRVLDAGLAPPPTAANDLETPVAYATMEPIDGRPLSDLIAEHPTGMPPRRSTGRANRRRAPSDTRRRTRPLRPQARQHPRRCRRPRHRARLRPGAMVRPPRGTPVRDRP